MFRREPGRMRNRSLRRVRFLTAAAAAGFAVRGAGAAAPFEFKCATNHSLEEPEGRQLARMLSTVARESGGRLAPQFFPNSSLGGDAAVFSQLRLGAIQFVQTTPAVLSELVPSANVPYLGFTFKDTDELFRVMDGKVGAYVQGELAAKGLHAFPLLWDAGMFLIGSNTRPIATPADLHGFKIRVSGSPVTIDMFKQLGAIPATLSYGEVYTALQTRLIDGEATTLTGIAGLHFYEVNKCVSLTNHGWAGDWLVANQEYWQTLPADLQGIVERNAARFAREERAESKALSADLVASLANRGLTFNNVNPAPFRAALGPYFKNWANAFGPVLWGQLQAALGRRIG